MRQVKTHAKERPIHERGEMVRAILEGRKTQARRVARPPRGYEHNNVCRPDMAAGPGAVWWHGLSDRVGCLQECPCGQPGDRLWVRETWAMMPECHPVDSYPIYRATDPGWDDNGSGLRWRPSIHMPRWASRILLEITDVRVERLNEIIEEDAQAEGIECVGGGRYWLGFDVDKVLGTRKTYGSAIDAFRSMWQSIYGTGSFDERWVWVIDFRRIDTAKP